MSSYYIDLGELSENKKALFKLAVEELLKEIKERDANTENKEDRESS